MSEAGGGLFYPVSPDDEHAVPQMDRPAAILTPDELQAVMDDLWRGDL